MLQIFSWKASHLCDYFFKVSFSTVGPIKDTLKPRFLGHRGYSSPTTLPFCKELQRWENSSATIFPTPV